MKFSHKIETSGDLNVKTPIINNRESREYMLVILEVKDFRRSRGRNLPGHHRFYFILFWGKLLGHDSWIPQIANHKSHS